MARKIAMNEGFRAVILRKDVDGETVTRFEGVYDKDGTAKGRVTFWRKYLGEDFIDGWTERATITWERT